MVLLDDYLRKAVLSGATDCHLVAGSVARMRVGGEIVSLGTEVLTGGVLREMFRGLMDAYANSQFNKTGTLDLSYAISGVARFRVNLYMQKGDFAGVFRVLPNEILPFERLGLPLGVYNLHRSRRGLFLVVGVTGSGKSTTLASFVDVVNKNMRKNIITLEDPIEYLHWHGMSLVSQREVGKDCGSFGEGLRSALREDPDVIVVGEIRDYETMDIALKAAETGHLVCSTLHTMGVVETVGRIIDMYPAGERELARGMLGSVLSAVVVQQLLPAVGGGFVLAYELMFGDKSVRDFVGRGDLEGLRSYVVSESARARGMMGMDDCIYGLYRGGRIDRAVALDYAVDRVGMEARIYGRES